MRRDRRFLLKFFIATSLLALLPFGVARWQENRRRNAPKQSYAFPFAELEALDKVVQARFAVVPDKDFGMGRVGKRHEYFNPATPQEHTVVGGLQQDVYFYVAGRRTLLKQYSRAIPPVIQGPIVMSPRVPLKTQHTVMEKRTSSSSIYFKTPGKLPRDLPSEDLLRHLGREALPAFDTAEGITKQGKGWQIAMVPVRVSQQACADCHWYIGEKWFGTARLTPRIGDTLGVAMYAYRQKGKP